MKKYFFLILLLPFTAIAQKSKTGVKAKPVIPASETKTIVTPKSIDGFLINGNITGFPDNTPVTLLNANTGAQEASTTIVKNQFTIAGKVPTPDFKVILFNNQRPYISIFLDNNLISINGRSDSLERAEITGSPSNDDFVTLSNIVTPNQALFQEGNKDSLAKKAIIKTIITFVKQRPNSYVAPLGVFRVFQLNADVDMMENLFNGLTPEVKVGPIGSYVSQQIAIGKVNQIGKVVPDFSQADSAGKMVKLSSLRGKYVLIDFWASWCGPCRQENPNVVATYNKYKNKNYTVLGVSFDRAKAPWVEAIKMDGLSWHHVSDLQGWSNAVGQQFQITKIPQNLLIDPNGVLIGKNLRGADLQNKLASLFGY